MEATEIRQFVEQVEPFELIRRFDVDFDIPLRQGLAIGILRMQGAYDTPRMGSDVDSLALYVGSHWCDIVRADVQYETIDGLRLVERSRAAAEHLLAAVDTGRAGKDAAYAVARWLDGSAKIDYRLGTYWRARSMFDKAARVAIAHELWWCAPDISSNRLRVRLEEINQAARGEGFHLEDVRDWIVQLQSAVDDYDREAFRRNISIYGNDAPTSIPKREYMRGVCSLLHNLSFAHKHLAQFLQPAAASEELMKSRRASNLSLSIARRLGDGYREAQALLHQAMLPNEDQGRDLFQDVLDLPWRRGKLIARQRLAAIVRGSAGRRELRTLVDEANAGASAAGRDAGVDIEVLRHTIDRLSEIVAELRPSGASVEEEDGEVVDLRMDMVRSVRRVVALPAYKRTYARTVQPIYRSAIARSVGQLGEDAWEDALSLAEEAAGRELLDLMTSSALPYLPEPPPPPRQLSASLETSYARAPGIRGRRKALRRSDEAEEWHRDILIARETEFESQFLDAPLEAAAHDSDIGHRLAMFTTNFPGTCVIRYFIYGTEPALAATVVRDGRGKLVTEFDLASVTSLVDRIDISCAPTPSDCRAIWDLLIDPVWRQAFDDDGQVPDHLIIVPSGVLFAIPLHVAKEPSSGRPLGALVPLSHSVSVTALVTRGRHLLRRQPVSLSDDLAALVAGDDLDAREIVLADWDPHRLHVAGTVIGIGGGYTGHRADWEGLQALSAIDPEFFVYVGHGEYIDSFRALGPFLQICRSDGTPDDLTSFDVALRVRLPRNRLSVIGACLAGQGAHTDSDDIAGFLRAFIAAGAGALAIPLWAVQDEAMAFTVGGLLASSRTAVGGDAIFDVVETLHRQYRTTVDNYPSDGPDCQDCQDCQDRDECEQCRNRLEEWLPLALYL